MPYILEIENAIVETLVIEPLRLTFLEKIPIAKANEFVEIHNLAKREITQEIIDIPMGVIQNPPAMWDSSLRFCIIETPDNIIIGYGIGHDNYDKKKTYYVNTIYILPEYRNTGLSKVILNRFIQHFINLENYTELHAITQENNNQAIALLNRKQFQYII